MYTIDQVASMLSCTDSYIKNRIGYFQGRTVVSRTPDDLLFINIAKPTDTAEWRCTEKELLRYLKRKGFKVVDTPWT